MKEFLQTEKGDRKQWIQKGKVVFEKTTQLMKASKKGLAENAIRMDI